jgi:hypothetical protein
MSGCIPSLRLGVLYRSAVRFTDWVFDSDGIPPINRWAIVIRPPSGLVSLNEDHVPPRVLCVLCVSAVNCSSLVTAFLFTIHELPFTNYG